MGVEQTHAPMRPAEPRDLGRERRMIGVEVEAPSRGDFSRVRRLVRPVERLAVEGGGWAELGRRLARIERRAARIAIDVDDRARESRAHERSPDRRDEIVKVVKPPIRVLAREPGIDEGWLKPQKVNARVGNADDERRLAALDDKPVGILGAHRASLSSPGSAAAPTASTTAPSLTSLVAAAMSG